MFRFYETSSLQSWTSAIGEIESAHCPGAEAECGCIGTQATNSGVEEREVEGQELNFREH